MSTPPSVLLRGLVQCVTLRARTWEGRSIQRLTLVIANLLCAPGKPWSSRSAALCSALFQNVLFTSHGLGRTSARMEFTSKTLGSSRVCGKAGGKSRDEDQGARSSPPAPREAAMGKNDADGCFLSFA